MQATALIAEDEPLLADALRAELARQWPTLQCVAIARNGLQAIEQAVTLQPDIAFLDIRMPGASGLEVAQAIAEDWDSERAPPLLVFVTAYDEFAVQAFEQSAVDYLLKPVQPQRLAQTLQRVRDRLSGRRDAPASIAPERSDLGATGVDVFTTGASSKPAAGAAAGESALRELVEQLRRVLGHEACDASVDPAPSRLRSIKASVGDTVHLVPIDDILYLQASDKYVNVVTAQAEYLIREPLKELLPRLDADRFAQIHRGTVVNLDAVSAAIRDDRGRTQLRLRALPTLLTVSRLYMHLFKPM